MARMLTGTTSFDVFRRPLVAAIALMVVVVPALAQQPVTAKPDDCVTRDAVRHLVNLGLIAESEVAEILRCAAPVVRTACSEEPLACAPTTTQTDAIAPVSDDGRYKVVSYAAPPSTASTAAVSLDQYCTDMAAMLTTQMQAESITPADQQRAIETALRIVVRNTEMHLEARIDRLKARFERELAAREIDQRQAAALLDVKPSEPSLLSIRTSVNQFDVPFLYDEAILIGDRCTIVADRSSDHLRISYGLDER